MGWDVKNVVRAQSKYGLMGSSAKTGKKIFRGSQQQFLDKTVIWDRTPPQLYMKYSVYVWGRAQGSQIFKRNSIISIRSKGMAFLVILLSLRSPCCPRHPHIIPVVHTSSLCRPRHPHVVPIAPRRSPCGLHGCGLRGLRCLHPMLSPCCPRGPHIIPVVPTSSLCRPHGPHIIPVVPVSSPLSPRRPCVIPIVPTSSRRSPHHP